MGRRAGEPGVLAAAAGVDDRVVLAVEAIGAVHHARSRDEVVAAHDDQIGKLSVVGAGMRTHSGVSATLFEALSIAGINIEMISTSEIRISVVVRGDDLIAAARVVHSAYGLDGEDDAIIHAGSGR